MKVSNIKKMLTGALAVALVVAPVMSVTATETNEAETVVEQVVEQVAEPSATPVVEERVYAPAPAEEDTSAPVAEIPATSAVAGTKTSTPGVYMATSVTGTAVSSGAATITEGYGLTGTERPYSKFSDLSAKKSPLAAAAIDAAAASQGAKVGPMLNVELGKMSGGKYSLLPSDGPAIRLAFGIPKNFASANATFAVVCVRSGGAVSILADVDDNPNTVTFDTTGGAGAYAIIKY